MAEAAKLTLEHDYNMFDNHPPFQIDGNFVATAAIAEKLVQSTSERIVLLPALPENWPDGRIKGLCVRGGAEIDLQWSRGQLTSCTIRAKKAICTKIFYKNKVVNISMIEKEVLLLPLS